MTHILYREGAADQWLALSDLALAEANAIATAYPTDAASWHIYDQLKAIGASAFDIQACILRANQPTDKETEMQDITFTPLTTAKLPEMCEDIEDLLAAVDRELAIDQDNNDLYLAGAALRQAIASINGADDRIARWSQARADSAAVDAIITALRANYGSNNNAGPANGMLADIASPAGATMILKVIRDSGYVLSPEPPF